MGNTGPESSVPPAASGGGGAGLRPAGAAAGQRREAELTFEQAHQELERIVERLERGQAGLDETIALWERGEELYRLCLARLDSARGRIEELARREENAGAPETGAL
jgi:exodeoxyribonuclease VII small subunit